MNRINLLGENVKTDDNLNIIEQESYCLSQLILQKGDISALSELCEDFVFLHSYLIFKDDLLFNSIYYKPNFDLKKINPKLQKASEKRTSKKFNKHEYEQVRKKQIQQGLIIPLTSEEVRKHKNFLLKIAEKWNDTVKYQRHSDQLLKSVCEETRKKLKKQNRKCTIDESHKILWKSKYIYLLIKKLLLENGLETILPYKMELNQKEVFFTIKGLVHLLFGHFMQSTSSELIAKKSFHNPEFEPKKVHLGLDKIFKKMNKSVLIQEMDIEINISFNFRYKNVDYQLYFKQEDSFFCISSFYPIEKNIEKKKIDDNYRLEMIDNDIGLYIKN